MSNCKARESVCETSVAHPARCMFCGESMDRPGDAQHQRREEALWSWVISETGGSFADNKIANAFRAGYEAAKKASG